ncbi:MAG: aminotransferase class V-fold PLP-dependent enzyme, partial [Actinomycetota bacterium]|nr:aminotransferase class V-fold PLP-dependent enzyme [Actinomycetota bacterium]
MAGNEFVYLNSGGSGPPTRETISAVREVDDLCSGPAYLKGVEFYAHQGATYARAREAAARLTGVNPDDIALTQSTTHGMNLGTFALDWKA